MQKNILVLLGLVAATTYAATLKTKTTAQQTAFSTNVLLNAAAWQSSEPYGDVGKARNAVDGGRTDSNCRWNGQSTNSLTHTNSETNPWWKADMGATKNIKWINVWNRLDCCGERLAGYQIRIGNNADMWENPSCEGTFTGSQSIKCELSGRYIGVWIPGQGKILTLCEVEAYENFPVQFQAVSATQSSSPYGDVGKASNAIDGSKQCSWTYNSLNSLTHTNQETNPWWNADLGTERHVTGLRTYNRADCCQDRLANYEVRIGNDANLFNNAACPLRYNGEGTIQCNLRGRYVGIFIKGTGILTLCEVEIFGVPL